MNSRHASLASTFALALTLALVPARKAAAQTWTAQTTNVTVNVAAIHFATENIGYAAAGTSILKTTNGGDIWTNIYPNEWTYRSFSFVNKDTGWAVGNGGDIRKTTNGGTTWVNQTNNGGGTTPLGHVVFASSLAGFASRADGTTSTGNVIRTANGGTTWIPDTIGANNRLVNKFQFLTPAIGWAIGGVGVYKTIDSGNTWISAATGLPTVVSWNALKFVTPDIGYVAGYSEGIYKTTNGGTSWTAQLTGTFQGIGDITWNSLDCLDTSTCFASGTGGAYMPGGFVYKTTNGGAAWTQNLNLNPGVINGLVFPSAAGGYIIGTNGMIRKSSAVVAILPSDAAAAHAGLRIARSAAGWNVGYSVQADQPVTVSVLDLQGRPVWSSTASAKAGDNTLLIPASGFSAGVQILEFRSSAGRDALLLPANRLR